VKRVPITPGFPNPSCQSKSGFWTCTEHLETSGKFFHVATHTWDCSDTNLLAVWDDEGRSYVPPRSEQAFLKVVAYIETNWLPEVSEEELLERSRSLALDVQEIEELL
jgi:hypothetical protein